MYNLWNKNNSGERRTGWVDRHLAHLTCKWPLMQKTGKRFKPCRNRSCCSCSWETAVTKCNTIVGELLTLLALKKNFQQSFYTLMEKNAVVFILSQIMFLTLHFRFILSYAILEWICRNGWMYEIEQHLRHVLLFLTLVYPYYNQWHSCSTMAFTCAYHVGKNTCMETISLVTVKYRSWSQGEVAWLCNMAYFQESHINWIILVIGNSMDITQSAEFIQLKG